MLQRALTGAVFVIIMVAAILVHPITAYTLFWIFTVIGLNEFFSLAKNSGTKPQRAAGILAGIVLYGLTGLHFLYPEKNLVQYAFIIPFLLFIFELYRKTSTPLQNIAVSLLGAIYVAFPFALLLYFATLDTDGFLYVYNPWILLGYIILIWTNDTGAYLAGTFMGKKKFFPKHSPKKTWEGFIGGVIMSLIVAIVLFKTVEMLSLFSWIIIALLVSVGGTLGDLTESMFKRSAGVKDSGKLMPGHGGVLDRFDAVFISAPFVWIYLSALY
jgi:phosphatidate cytidylyltransferase